MNNEQPIKGWVKVKDKTPDKPNSCFRQLWISEVNPEVSQWMYFNGAIDEYDRVYDVDSSVDPIDQDNVEWLDETPIQSGEERWISVENRPLFTKDKENIWTLTEDGSKEFFAAIPYNDKQQPGKELWWIRHCIIDDGGLKVVGDDDNEPAGWSLEDITHWRPFLKPPNGEQKSNTGEERLFTLKEIREAFTNCYNIGKVHPGNNRNKDEQQYFKEKFGILLSSEQKVNKSEK